jgi:5'-nucleotidase
LASADFSLLVDAGGFARGYDPFSQIQNKYLVKGLGMLQYAAINLGYREWGSKPSVLRKLEEEFKVDFLCANVGYKDSTRTPFEPYLIREIQPNSGHRNLPFKKLRVAIVGLTDNKLAQLFVNKPGEAELVYRDPIEAAREFMPGLVKKSDLIILLYYGKFDMMKSLLASVPGFDIAVMGGESYLVASQTSSKDPIPVVSTPSMGKYVGILTLKVDSRKKIVSSSSRQVPLKEDMAEDARFNDLVSEFEKASQNPKSSS